MSSLQPVFGLSISGYCRNMAVQHGDPKMKRTASSVNVKGSFKDNENTKNLTFGLSYMNEI